MIDNNKNIYYSGSNITYNTRCKVLNQQGMVLWFTGLSGSGKSTIAIELEKKLVAINKACYRLDGDNVRFGLNSDLGFSSEDRVENIRRIIEVASLFKDAGLITLISFISPFKVMRENARNKIGNNFFEIYVKADVDTCKQRDPKGLYKKAMNNEIQDFTGISSPYEEPENPDLIIDTVNMKLEESVSLVYKHIKDKLIFN